ncbi:hypothetical protein HY413_04050 [Candidatus Kaiserbacteria bacterium]|nr:hypothetical protein [Candidatus Kaiserbacteria bacterium]
MMRKRSVFRRDSPGGLFRLNVALKLMLMFMSMFVIVVGLLTVQKLEQMSGEVNEPAESLKFEVFWNYDDPASADKPYKYKLVDVDADTGIWYRGGANNAPLTPVWFTNMGAGFINLERDDLGNRPGIESEFDPINYESAKTRGIPAGEYCVNVHLYRNRSSLTKIPVTVNVRVVRGQQRKQLDGRVDAPASSDKPILTSNVVFEREWQEINVFCFTMNEQFDLVPEKTFRSNANCFHNANTTQCE